MRLFTKKNHETLVNKLNFVCLKTVKGSGLKLHVFCFVWCHFYCFTSFFRKLLTIKSNNIKKVTSDRICESSAFCRYTYIWVFNWIFIVKLKICFLNYKCSFEKFLKLNGNYIDHNFGVNLCSFQSETSLLRKNIKNA